MAEIAFRNKAKKNKKRVLAGVRELLAAAISKKGEYTEAVGRRKTATARVRLYPAKKTEWNVNGKELKDYFKTDRLAGIASAALTADGIEGDYFVSVLVKGSGDNAQAEAVRLGVARALVKIDEMQRPTLKALGYMKRDPRSVERKKFGLKKARKAPTWVKR